MCPAVIGRLAAPTADGSAGRSALHRLQELKRMLDGGLITPAEYETKKGEILAEL